MLFVAGMLVSSGISDGCRVADLELDTLGKGVISLLRASTPSRDEKIWQLCRCKAAVFAFREAAVLCFLRLLLRPGTEGDDFDERLDDGRES